MTHPRRKWSALTWLGVFFMAVGALMIVAGAWTLDQWLNPRRPLVAINAVISEAPVAGKDGKVRMAEQPTGGAGHIMVPAAYVGEPLSLQGLAMCAAWPPTAEVNGDRLPDSAWSRPDDSGEWQLRVPTDRAGDHSVSLSFEVAADCRGTFKAAQTGSTYYVWPAWFQRASILGRGQPGRFTGRLTATLSDPKDVTLILGFKAPGGTIPVMVPLSLRQGTQEIPLDVPVVQIGVNGVRPSSPAVLVSASFRPLPYEPGFRDVDIGTGTNPR